MISRRRLMLLLGGAASVPALAGAEQPSRPVVAWLSSGSAIDSSVIVDAVHGGLREMGFVDGRNATIEFHWAEGQYDRLPAMAAALVERRVAAIIAGALPAALAAKAATSTIPIVFVTGADPVRQRLVASLGRPGRNITGITQYYGALGGKRLEQLRELVPNVALIAVLSNPDNANAESHLADIAEASRALGLAITIFHAGNEPEISAAFARIRQSSAAALLIADDPLYRVLRERLVSLAAQHALPTSYFSRDFVAVGGLIGYGSSRVDNLFQAGIYAGRVLRGADPADLPVIQPTRFELAINLRTAAALGIEIPSSLLARADEVIE